MPTPAVLPQPALTSEVLAPVVELEPSNAGVFTPPVAPKPFDAVKVTPKLAQLWMPNYPIGIASSLTTG